MRIKPTYRDKFLLLIALTALVCVIAYKKSIKGTVEIYNECERLEKEIVNSETLIKQIPNLREKYNDMNLIIKGQNNTNELSMQQELLDLISEFTLNKKIKLESFDPIHYYTENNYTIKTQSFTLKGDYISSIQLIDFMETNFDLSRISSVYFYKKRNYNSDNSQLYAKIYLQKISQI